MALSEPEQQLWEKIRAQSPSFEGVPQAVCPTITPFPFWGVIAAIVIFLPLALIMAFVLKRQAVMFQAGEVVVVELSFWRMRPAAEPLHLPPGTAPVSRRGSALLIGERKYHLQPGWEEPAERLAELASA